MTITVVTPDHGEKKFDANDWEILNENSPNATLWIGSGDDGVAEFSNGSWLFVYETVDVDPSPRTTKTLTEDHRDAAWLDSDGWKFEHLSDGKWSASGAHWPGYGPYTYSEPIKLYPGSTFTEVVE